MSYLKEGIQIRTFVLSRATVTHSAQQTVARLQVKARLGYPVFLFFPITPVGLGFKLNETGMDDKVGQLLEDSLVKVWSERNQEQRMQVMKRIYADDIVFYETDNGPAIQGHLAIDSLIKTLQSQWPPEFVFTLTKPVVTNHGVSHVAWTLGEASAAPAASGMDIAIIESGLIQKLYLYLDVPAG